MNKKLLLGIGALAMALSIGLAACDTGSGNKNNKDIPAAQLPTTPAYGGDVAVHDPSIFKDDDGTYYAFGTHYAVASSTDLISWTQRAGDGNYSFLYGTGETVTYSGKQWPAALDETLKVVQPEDKGSDTISTTWAPDVIKIGNKYYMYYSITRAFGSRTSAIGRVEADSVTGPYTNNQVIVTSGGSSGPNAIDPTVFWDNDGKLWMVYGSAYGGIYIVQLNASGDKVGLPTDEYQDMLDSREFGESLWSGSGNNAEGPYIFYNSDTGYYYLMCSYHDLSSTYNMRVARSKTVNGVYEDIMENEMDSDPSGGNKLAGNYQFEGDSVNRALGHNSVLVEDGKYLAVMHVRNAMGGHHLEVRQLFFTESGWPVLSPNRYAGETIGTVTTGQFAGDFDVIFHSTSSRATDEIVASTVYTFSADGKILEGEDEAGTWSLSNGYCISIVIEGEEFEGVVAPGWCNYQNRAVFSITAVSKEDGNALWANPAALK